MYNPELPYSTPDDLANHLVESIRLGQTENQNMIRLTLTPDDITAIIEALEAHAEDRRYQAEFEGDDDAQELEAHAERIESIAADVRAQQLAQRD